MQTANVQKSKTIRSQIYFLQPEQWKADHDEAMRVRDLEHMIQLAIAVEDCFEEWNANSSVTTEQLPDVAALFQMFVSAAILLRDESERFSRDYEIDGLDRLRDICNAGQARLPFTLAMADSARQILDGNCRELSEVMHELLGENLGSCGE